MRAELIGHTRWALDLTRKGLANFTPEDVVHAYDLADGRYEPAGDSDTELVLTAPFEIRLPIRDTTR